jgi:hypothetical protein
MEKYDTGTTENLRSSETNKTTEKKMEGALAKQLNKGDKRRSSILIALKGLSVVSEEDNFFMSITKGMANRRKSSEVEVEKYRSEFNSGDDDPMNTTTRLMSSPKSPRRRISKRKYSIITLRDCSG